MLQGRDTTEVMEATQEVKPKIPYEWGKTVEMCALQAWQEFSNSLVRALPDRKAVDAVVLPLTTNSTPYFLEVKARLKPFATHRDVPLRFKVLSQIRELTRISGTQVAWLVVWPDQAGYVMLSETRPSAHNHQTKDDPNVYFDRELFTPIPQELHVKHFQTLYEGWT